MPLEQIDNSGEVSERSSQAVNFIYNDDVNESIGNIIEQMLQGGTLDRATGVSTIVIVAWQQSPTQVLLALDISLTGLPLCL